jgi:hypothetical protein
MIAALQAHGFSPTNSSSRFLIISILPTVFQMTSYKTLFIFFILVIIRRPIAADFCFSGPIREQDARSREAWQDRGAGPRPSTLPCRLHGDEKVSWRY